jgi:hypothetical protein
VTPHTRSTGSPIIPAGECRRLALEDPSDHLAQFVGRDSPWPDPPHGPASRGGRPASRTLSGPGGPSGPAKYPDKPPRTDPKRPPGPIPNAVKDGHHGPRGSPDVATGLGPGQCPSDILHEKEEVEVVGGAGFKFRNEVQVEVPGP